MTRNNNLYTLTSCALMAAVLCILAPMVVPIGPIPISLASFLLYITAYILGGRSALISCGIYVLLGAAGLPVFSGYAGGLAKLTGPTGGYIIGYLFMVYIAGKLIDKFCRTGQMDNSQHSDKARSSAQPEQSVQPGVSAQTGSSSQPDASAKRCIFMSIAAMVIGTAVLYLFGTIWFVVLMKCDIPYALSVCVFPFIPLDILKIIAATFIGKAVRTAMEKAHLLPA